MLLLIQSQGMAKGNPLSGSSPPWQQMVNDPSAFFGVDQLPDGFELKDPSKMTKDPLILLLTTWVAKQKEGQVAFRFHHTIDSEGNMVEADCPPETNVKSKRTRKKKVVEDLAAEGDDESDTGAEGSMRRRTRTDRKTSVRIRPGAADEIDKGAVGRNLTHRQCRYHYCLPLPPLHTFLISLLLMCTLSLCILLPVYFDTFVYCICNI